MSFSILCSSLFLFFFLCMCSPSIAQQSFRPKALVVPVSKDASTLQYVTHIHQRTPLLPINLLLHLGGKYLWVDCHNNYVSSTYRPARCRSALCSLADSNGCGNCFSPPSPGCNNNTCGVSPDNPITNTATGGELATDVVSVNSTDGSNPGRIVTVPRFLFSCAPTFLLQGLANGVVGIAGLGRNRAAFPSQLAAAFSLQRKFAICLASTPTVNGVIFFGDGPYNFLPNVEFTSESLSYTPLFINPVSTAGTFSEGEPSVEYFIGITSIKINDETVPLNTTLLRIDSEGNGGSKISSVNPYTVMESSIFKGVTEAFIREAESMNISRVESVAPFDVCFSKENVLSTRLGYGVPTISLVLQNEKVVWRIYGANSIVEVSEEVLCVGVVNGGLNPRSSIVIGGYQLENNLIQFDLATSRLGFSSLLFGRRTTCANFNFTSVA
ncbi:probable aspartic proteinase GIP2 [Euphorbia lathyris]|uniref:probable aspartic proteinase GIP2 n=1 Tax=Euphorbia lathyris TaxID=212925 RepID=UPI00331346CA